jgi:hypothetical protein
MKASLMPSPPNSPDRRRRLRLDASPIAWLARIRTCRLHVGGRNETALLARRLADAGAACGGADDLSERHRNMEHAGLRLLSVRTIWVAE